MSPDISSRRSQSSLRPSIFCWLLILAFALFLAALAAQQHQTFQTNGLDLGNVDQALWNTAQGRFLHFTLMAPVQSRLALHVEPILLLWVPFYWFRLGGPDILLISQAVIVALGAWPLYRLAVSQYQSTIKMSGAGPAWLAAGVDWLALVFPLAYLLLPTLEAATLYDFHAVTLAPTFLLFAFWMLEQKHDRRFILFILLAMACKEDMPLVVAMLGLYLGLARQRWRLAGATIGLSAAWFVLAFFVIQPRFAAGGNIQLDRYAWLGDSPRQIIQTIISQPGLLFEHFWYQVDVLAYLGLLFFPTAFLALLSPLTLLPALPTLAINLLSANPFTWRLEDFHYGAPLAPFLFISTIYGITWLSQRLGAWDRQKLMMPLLSCHLASLVLVGLTLLTLAFSMVYHYYRGFTPLARPFIWPKVTAHHQQLAEVIATVPGQAALFAQSNLAPHLAQRPILYTEFAYFTDPAYPAAAHVTEILLDVTSLENVGNLQSYLRRTLLESGDYRLVTARDGILYLRSVEDKAASSAPLALPADFYTFAYPDSPPDYQLSVDFGDVARLQGYSLHFKRQEEVQASIDLVLLQPLASPGLQPVLYLLDANGRPLGATDDLQPALAWFPPDRWPVGQTVRVRFNTLPWPGYTRQGMPYRLALGLVNGSDVWADPRYRPALSEPTDLAVRLPAEGSLVELARISHVWGMPEGGPLRRQFTAPALPHSLQVNFDHRLQLLGYSTPQLSTLQASGPTLSITFYWQAMSALPPLTRFVQLIEADGQIYGQRDSAPDDGNYPTYLWQPGEVVADTVVLSLETAHLEGSYTLHLGFYDPDSGQRLPVISGGDHVEIAVDTFFHCQPIGVYCFK